MHELSPIILFQEQITPTEEIQAAINNNVEYSFSRVNLKDRLVVPRYGLLPFYKEMEKDVLMQNAKLINSYAQHRYIANFEYYHDIKEYTPKTYFQLNEIQNLNKKFVVKGITNSKKSLWNTQMFAENQKQAQEIYFKLLEDKYIQSQDIIIREFVELEVLEYGINNLPFANEWRFFYYQNNMLSYGYYWSMSENKGLIDPEAFNLADKVAQIVSPNINFFVIDVAKTKSGEWIVIELNDGCMSGLSDNDPNILYNNLFKKLNECK